MMFEIRTRKPERTLLPTEGIFNLPHHVGLVWEELAFDDTVIHSREMDCSIAKCYNREWDSYPCAQGHIPHALTNWANQHPQSI